MLGVDVRGVTGFEVHYGQPEPLAESVRLRFDSTVQGGATLKQGGGWQAHSGRARGVASGNSASVTVCLDAVSDQEAWVASIDKIVLLGKSAEQPSTPKDTYRLEAESYDDMFGVRYQPTTDTGGGQNAGWIGRGDYIEWDLRVAKAGSYELVTRSASSKTATYRILIDGTQVTTKTIADTGGWQNWRYFTTSAFQVDSGDHTLRIEFTSDGQNLNWLKLQPARSEGTGVCAGTTGSKVVGQTLCVDGAPWLMKGVNYNPIERCEWNEWQNWGASANDAALMAQGKFNTIRTFAILSDKVLFSAGGAALTCKTAADCPDPAHNVCTPDAEQPSRNVCRTGFLSDAHLSEFLRRGIRVIPTVHVAGGGPAGAWNVSWVDQCGDGSADNPGPAGGDFPTNYKTHLNRILNHDAVIAASVGNEIAYNFFYTKDPGGAWTNCWTLDDTVSHANYVVGRVKAVNSKKPVVVSWGNTAGIDTKVPQLKADIISYQIYNKLSLDNVFTLHPRYSSKPFFISEAGADAYNADIGKVDTAAQAYGNVALFKQVLDNATTGAGGTAAHKVIGMTIFEFMDEYWKASGDSCVQDAGGVAPGGGPYPDITFNEEYWGIVENAPDPKTGMRKPRESFYQLRDLFQKY
jgi:hypothetical protein